MEEQQFIGSYKILKRIGAGGMARVYLAVHQDVPNLKVVLKVLTNPRMAERFRQEADKLALLDANPNIGRIKHFFNHGDDFVIAMDYIDGESLEQILEREGKIPVERACWIMTRVLEVLKAAHEKDISHRDIKPSNVMIDKDGHVKVIDFGIAKGKTDPNLTIAGTAAGTPAYMSPEQFSGAENIDYALVDIYAVGTTLYHMLTGELPFKSDNQFILRDAKLAGEPVNPAKVNPDIPKELAGIIMKSLRIQPEERFQSASEVIEALSPLCGRSESPKPIAIKETVAAAPKTTHEPAKKSKMMPLIIAAAAVIILVIAGLYLFFPSGEKTTETVSEETTPVTEQSNSDTSALPGGQTIAAVGILALTIAPSGDFYFDENLIGAAMAETSLTTDTGMHYIRVENKNAIYKILHDTIYLSPGETLPRRYTFEIAQVQEPEPKPGPKPVTGNGKVAVGSRPRGGEIYIDGKLQQQQTPFTFTLSNGRHIFKINVEQGGKMLSFTDTVNVEIEGSHRVFFNAEE
ncbi:MAG: serine/threonine-protein kinase [Candidatus Zixiibacteriota bacterium]